MRPGRLDAAALLAALTHLAYEDGGRTFCGLVFDLPDTDSEVTCPLCIAAGEALEDAAGGPETVDIRALWDAAVVGDFLPQHDAFPCLSWTGDGRWGCTRAARHVGQHVATGRGRVLAVWTEEAA
jgi:hypothetical protein